MYVQAVAQAEALRQAKREEKMQRMKQHKLSVSDKEKRKRNMGQQSRGKNFVVRVCVCGGTCHHPSCLQEEEKRVQRQYGMYSGFD